jgi:hypothetical protein
MKALAALAFTVVLALSADLLSQAPPANPKTPLQTLQAMKLQNQQLVQKQTQTLLKLEELEKETQQLKFLGKRS